MNAEFNELPESVLLHAIVTRLHYRQALIVRTNPVAKAVTIASIRDLDYPDAMPRASAILLHDTRLVSEGFLETLLKFIGASVSKSVLESKVKGR